MAFILFRLILLAMVLSAAAIVGQMLADHKGAVAGSILASLFVYVLHVRSGLRIIEWLDNFKVENVPDVSGWWDDLADRLFRYLRLHRLSVSCSHEA